MPSLLLYALGTIKSTHVLVSIVQVGLQAPHFVSQSIPLSLEMEDMTHFTETQRELMATLSAVSSLACCSAIMFNWPRDSVREMYKLMQFSFHPNNLDNHCITPQTILIV